MKEDIKDISSNINNVADLTIGTLKQRISNPFVGSFMITFAALNWRPIVYFLFSRKEIEDKFKFITENYYQDQWNGWLSWCMYLFFPMLISLFYLAILPWVTDMIDKFVEKTILNKSRRDHIINYRKRKNLADLAWADFKTEEARTGFEDRKKLNNELDILRGNLKKESDQVAALILSNQNFQEQINILNTSLKERHLEKEALNNDLEVTKKALNERQKFIKDQSSEITVKETTIESLNKAIRESEKSILELQNKNRELTQRTDELLSRNNILDAEVINLKTQYENEKNHNVELHNLNTSLSDEKSNLILDKAHLEEKIVQNQFDIDFLKNRLNQYQEFENSIELLKENYQRIISILPSIPNPDFYMYEDIAEFLRKSNGFVANLSEYLVNHRIDEENLLLQLYRINDQPETIVLNHIFSSARDLNIRIYNISFQHNSLIEISMNINDGNTLQNFIQNGNGYWDTEKWKDFSK